MINYNQQIYDGAVNNGATSWLAKLLIAQSRFETGDYGNNQSKTNNNICNCINTRCIIITGVKCFWIIIEKFCHFNLTLIY